MLTITILALKQRFQWYIWLSNTFRNGRVRKNVFLPLLCSNDFKENVPHYSAFIMRRKTTYVTAAPFFFSLPFEKVQQPQQLAAAQAQCTVNRTCILRRVDRRYRFLLTSRNQSANPGKK